MGVRVMTCEPWLIHFFQRHRHDDPNMAVPAIEFFDQLPAKLVAEFQAVLDAVAEAPPPAFSGGGKREAMHDEMAGFYEVRNQGGGMNHRLFCARCERYSERGGCGRAPSSNITGVNLSCSTASRAERRSTAISPRVEEMKTRSRWSGVRICSTSRG